MMDEIYYCRRIYKQEDSDIEKGDIGYISHRDLPDLISRYRLMLYTVEDWEEFLEDTYPYFKTKEPKIKIYSKDSSLIILLSLEEFDKIMIEYKSKIVQFKQN